MIVERRDGKVERKILIGMVASTEFLARLSDKWDSKHGLLNSKWSNIVGNWCITHYNKYGEAPLKHIESYFEDWSVKSARSKDEIKIVARFLDGLSGEYETLSEGINPEYLADQAAEHFNKIKAQRTNDQSQKLIEAGKIDDAVKLLQSFSRIEIGTGATVDVFHDKAAIRSAFEAKREPLIFLKGAVGELLGGDLERDAFVAFTAQDKAGKSFWLQEIAYQGAIQRRNTAYFILGDMSQGQIMLRLGRRADRRPLKCQTFKKNKKGKLIGTKVVVNYPTQIVHDPDERYATVCTDEKTYDKDLTWKEAYAAFEKVLRMKIKSEDSKLKLQCYPGGSVTVLEVEAQIRKWIRDGWTPDIIVLDYADNLAPIDGKVETRHQITATWQRLRGISQTFHCCMVTATQASRKAYGAYAITKDMFSENKMKNALVTAMYAVNQMEEEQEQDITRLGVLVRREGEFNPQKFVHVAGCRAIGNICIRSTW